jgi:excisionase family DNA binding protein
LPVEDERLLSVREVAHRLGVTTATVYKLSASDELPVVRVLNVIRIAPSSLRAFLERKR